MHGDALWEPAPIDRVALFWAKVRKGRGRNACWLWTAAQISTGYGAFWDGARMAMAHRWSYEHEVGPIPEGLVIDHVCRVPLCVRVSHLEVVTESENIRRGAGAAHHRNKTHCPQGHPYDTLNTYRYPSNGRRGCRQCDRDAGARYRARKRAEAA